MENEILGIEKKYLATLEAPNTASEIVGQPELWEKTWRKLLSNRESIIDFIMPLYKNEDLQIIITGAGTSAFIGEVLEGPFLKFTKHLTRAVPTTNLVTHPELYFHKTKPTLLISFARSGNSPESSKAVILAKHYCTNVYNLIITCNQEGKLVQVINEEQDFIFVLPPEADDKSLAMTGSFTSMLLTGLLISRIYEITELELEVKTLIEFGKNIIKNYHKKLRELSNLDFNRAVFLGSGLFIGIARESHLKLQELTNGRIICKHDSFLGFRHGPKAVIDSKTLIVYIISNNTYSQKYELDLVEAVNKSSRGIYSIAILENDISVLDVDQKIVMSKNGTNISEEFLTVVSILPAQILGFYKSLALGLSPDNPSKDGNITRVVQGVKLYDYNNLNEFNKNEF